MAESAADTTDAGDVRAVLPLPRLPRSPPSGPYRPALLAALLFLLLAPSCVLGPRSPTILHRAERSLKIKAWRRLGGALEVIDVYIPRSAIDGERTLANGQIELTIWVKVAMSKGLVPSEEHGYTEATIYHVGPIPDARPIAEIEQAMAARERERSALAARFHQAIADGVLELVDLRSRANRVTRAEDGGRSLNLHGAGVEVLIGVVVESLLPVKPLKQELRRARKNVTVQQQLDIKTLPLFERAMERDEGRGPGVIDFSDAAAALDTPQRRAA